MLPPLVTNKQEHHENTTNVDSWYNVINKSAYKTFSEGLWTRFYTRNTCAREETKIDSRT